MGDLWSWGQKEDKKMEALYRVSLCVPLGVFFSFSHYILISASLNLLFISSILPKRMTRPSSGIS